jgi:hypothetical protein
MAACQPLVFPIATPMPVPASDDDPAPMPPTPPDDDACCGNGCEPCIYDLYDIERYFAALRDWQARQVQRQAGPGNDSAH